MPLFWVSESFKGFAGTVAWVVSITGGRWC